MTSRQMKLFAVTAPGLEVVCAGELVRLEMAGVQAVSGGVEFDGDLTALYRANLWLRSATRVLVRMGEVRSRDFPDLFRKAVRLPWGRFIRPDMPVRIKAVSRRSRLSHSGRIGRTLGAAIDRALGRSPAAAGSGPGQLVLARFEENHCLLSIDSSGELLHRRGYREEAGPAPLRETLAAGILLLLGWDGAVPLVDPMCGSGTIPIEGALLAANRPPGGRRRFAFMDWPHFRPGRWEVLLREVESRAVAADGMVIRGSDRDGTAVELARRNARRAGVLDRLVLERKDLVDVLPPPGQGLVLCNPPYGERLDSERDLPSLFRRLGHVLQNSFPGWRAGFLCPEERWARETGLDLVPVTTLVNGGIRVILFASAGRIPAGKS